VSEPGESCDKGQAKAIIIGTDPPWTAQPAGDHCAARKAGLIARSILPSFSSLYGKGGTAQCEREERAIKTEVCPQEREIRHTVIGLHVANAEGVGLLVAADV
jgi:hypothetical protein